jgi:ribosomal protein S6 kinase alpha-1/2/3/6
MNNSYALDGGVWETISPLAKDLLRGLLTIDPRHRVTAAGALSHAWLHAEHSRINLPVPTEHSRVTSTELRQQLDTTFAAVNVSSSTSHEDAAVPRLGPVSQSGLLTRRSQKVHGSGSLPSSGAP